MVIELIANSSVDVYLELVKSNRTKISKLIESLKGLRLGTAYRGLEFKIAQKGV